MEFTFTHLLILLFLLLPLIERFFGKKKRGSQPAPDPVGTDYDDDTTDMTWEETLEQLETVIKGDKKPARLEQTYKFEAPTRHEFTKNEFKSTQLNYRSESLLDTPLVSAVEDIGERPSHIKVTRQNLREAIVMNEILLPPVSKRLRSLNRVS